MMAADARFEDAGEAPLRLRAEDAQDLAVVSALVQDAVTDASQASWMRRRRRFSLLLNRFRWEDAGRAEAEGRPFERVRSLLVADCALRVKAAGFDPQRREAVLCLLAARWEGGDEGAGTLLLDFAGGGAFAIEAECLDVTLVDVSRPYLARAGRVPAHPTD